MKVAHARGDESTHELNEPTAIFELTSSRGVASTNTSAHGSVARFEMNKEQIANLLEQFQQIQAKIENFA